MTKRHRFIKPNQHLTKSNHRVVANCPRRRKTLNVEIITIETGHPCIKVRYVDTHGNVCIGYMVLDSGSDNNHLLKLSKCDIVTAEPMGQKEYSCITFDNPDVTIQNVSSIFSIDSFNFKEDFGIDTTFDFSPYTQTPIIGIIGHKFMVKHSLVIDFETMRLHSSVPQDNDKFSNINYYFPMDLGLTFYNLPVVPIKNNGEQYFALLDSGSDLSYISLNALKMILNNNSDHMYMAAVGPDIMEIVENDELVKTNVGFEFVAINKELDFGHSYINTRVSIVNRKHIIQLPLPEKKVCDLSLSQIDVLLGSKYLVREKWILDFGNMRIYHMAS